jgi:hypothetical protein
MELPLSAHYYDAGSGPHDTTSRLNERGERNCGCRHNGQEWLDMCLTARTYWQLTHDSAVGRAAGEPALVLETPEE